MSKSRTAEARVEAETDFDCETTEGASLARREGSEARVGSRAETKEERTANPGSDTRLTAFSRAGTNLELTSSIVRVERKNGDRASCERHVRQSIARRNETKGTKLTRTCGGGVVFEVTTLFK